MKYTKMTVTNEQLGINPNAWGTTISDMLKDVMDAKMKIIDERLKEFGITTQNYKEFHIDIQYTTEGKKYIFYKKEKLGEFIA